MRNYNRGYGDIGYNFLVTPLIMSRFIHAAGLKSLLSTWKPYGLKRDGLWGVCIYSVHDEVDDA